MFEMVALLCFGFIDGSVGCMEVNPTKVDECLSEEEEYNLGATVGEIMAELILSPGPHGPPIGVETFVMCREADGEPA